MRSLLNYLNDVMAELRKVTWPDRDMLITSTVVVIGVSLAFAGYIMIIDKLLNYVVGFILKG